MCSNGSLDGTQSEVPTLFVHVGIQKKQLNLQLLFLVQGDCMHIQYASMNPSKVKEKARVDGKLVMVS